MKLDRLTGEAQANLRELADNPYPGRGIVIGMAPGGEPVQIYWIMGRSENSRNRVFEADGGTLRTAAADPGKMANPELVIYTAMRELPGHFVVTNGDHTEALAEGLAAGRTFAESLMACAHEPDGPHWTPRIAGAHALSRERVSGHLAVIKADPADTGRSLRQFFHYQGFAPGLGWCVTTYRGDGTPLPSFAGEPYPLPLSGDSEALADEYWGCLNGDNRVALAVKSIDPGGGTSTLTIRNRFEQRGAGDG